MDKLDVNDPRPPYQQVASRLRGQLGGGTYQVGDKLPTHHDVATEYGVSVATVKRAFAALQDAGLIVTRRGQGAYVRIAGPDVPADPVPVVEANAVVDIYGQLAEIRLRLEAVERQQARQE